MKKILYSLLTMSSSLLAMDGSQKKAEERFLATYQERARLSLPTNLQDGAIVAKASLQAAELLDRYKAVYARAAYAYAKNELHTISR